MSDMFPQDTSEEPTAEEAPAQVPEAEASEPGELRVDAVRSSILVVEDDPDNRELLVEILDSWGYEAIPASSAEEAELTVRRRLFRAALVDVFLPGKSGTALISLLRESYPEVLLIGMSGLADAALARRCKGQGADLFIEKPLQIEELAEALKAQHRSWH